MGRSGTKGTSTQRKELIMAAWIDFKELREKLRFVEVLKHFNVEVKIRDDRATGFCPLPSHPKRENGKRRSASFSANLNRGIFQCFGCGAKGNAIDFAARLLGYDPEDPAQFRQAA